jgi:hypothetical protein
MEYVMLIRSGRCVGAPHSLDQEKQKRIFEWRSRAVGAA